MQFGADGIFLSRGVRDKLWKVQENREGLM